MVDEASRRDHPDGIEGILDGDVPDDDPALLAALEASPDDDPDVVVGMKRLQMLRD